LKSQVSDVAGRVDGLEEKEITASGQGVPAHPAQSQGSLATKPALSQETRQGVIIKTFWDALKRLEIF